MAYVICEVEAGLRESEATVVIRDSEGHSAFLRVERDFIQTMHDQNYLPVGVVYIDAQSDLTLIELPHEADSGVNRVWVPSANISQGAEVAA